MLRDDYACVCIQLFKASLTRDKGKAKAYQVRQVLLSIERLGVKS
jgi:hypothetical protein